MGQTRSRRTTAPGSVLGSSAVRARASAAGYGGPDPLKRKHTHTLYLTAFLGGAPHPGPTGLDLPPHSALMFAQDKEGRAAELTHPLILPHSRWTVPNRKIGKQ